MADESAALPTDPTMVAIAELRSALAENAADERRLDHDLADMQRARRKGGSWRDIVAQPGGGAPLTLLGRVLQRLNGVSGNFRRSLATTLVEEGEHASGVARHFGVSRQRIFSLLRRRT